MRSLQKGESIQLTRRGYFFVDKIPLKDQKMQLNFVPDGRSQNISKIKGAVDAKATAKGIGADDKGSKKQEVKEGSKKALAKEAKKAKKAAAKGGEPSPAVDGQAAVKEKKDKKPSEAKVAGPVVTGLNAELLAQWESNLAKNSFLGGMVPAQDDAEALS